MTVLVKRMFYVVISVNVYFHPPAIAQQNAVEFPPLIDPDDIAYFFENDDLDGLHWALTNIFANSERVHIDAPPQKLPAQIVSRGGGLRYTTEYKLRHDLEQAEYLASHLSDPEQAKFFGETIFPIFHGMLDRIPALEELNGTNGLYPFTKEDFYEQGMGSVYNRALRLTDFEELKDANGKLIPLLNPDLDVDAIEKTMLSEGVVVIDNLLTLEALERIRQVMLESTVFFQTKMPQVFGGYVGAYIDDGLHDRILLQLAFELYRKLPKIMKGHFLRYLWAYKYDSTLTGINTHADQAAVNVNIWLTPDDASLDPDSGGLVVFTVKPPMDWDFEKFNTATDFVHETLLGPSGYANKTIPHRQNRAVIFDSAFFHHTDSFKFKPGYENRRINLTLLYGKMRMASATSTTNEL